MMYGSIVGTSRTGNNNIEKQYEWCSVETWSQFNGIKMSIY